MTHDTTDTKGPMLWTDKHADAWAAFADATRVGTQAQTLAALGDLLAVCPEMRSWFERASDGSSFKLDAAIEGAPYAFEVGGEDYEAAADAVSLDDYLDHQAALDSLHAELDQLSDDDPVATDAIRRWYGLDGIRPESLPEIGASYGVSRTMAGNHRDRGIRLLRATVKGAASCRSR